MKIRITPNKIFNNLWLITFILTIANLLAIGVSTKSDDIYLNSIAELFDFDTEQSLPTLYSTLLLITSFLLLLYIFKSSKKINRKQWFLLSVILAFLSFDEFLSLHEHLIPFLRQFYKLEGLFYYGWIIPYGIVVFFLGLWFVPFLRSLKKSISLLFMISGFLYISGAIGMEMFGGKLAEMHGEADLSYRLVYTLEETLEMLGLTLFIYSLSLYISQNGKYNRLNFKITL